MIRLGLRIDSRFISLHFECHEIISDMPGLNIEQRVNSLRSGWHELISE
jgi:hypothetical protein